MVRVPPISTPTDTLFPYTTLVLSRDSAGMLAVLCDRAQHRLAAAADRIAAQGGEGVMGALKGILAIVGVAMILVGGLWALQGLDIIRWPAECFMLGDTIWKIGRAHV